MQLRHRFAGHRAARACPASPSCMLGLLRRSAASSLRGLQLSLPACPPPCGCSESIRDLISRMLVLDPNLRCSLKARQGGV